MNNFIYCIHVYPPPNLDWLCSSLFTLTGCNWAFRSRHHHHRRAPALGGLISRQPTDAVGGSQPWPATGKNTPVLLLLLGSSGPNLKPGTLCVCGMHGLRQGMHITLHPPSPTSRAGTDLPTDVQTVSRAVSCVSTHRPRFQVRARPSYYYSGWRGSTPKPNP